MKIISIFGPSRYEQKYIKKKIMLNAFNFQNKIL